MEFDEPNPSTLPARLHASPWWIWEPGMIGQGGLKEEILVLETHLGQPYRVAYAGSIFAFKDLKVSEFLPDLTHPSMVGFLSDRLGDFLGVLSRNVDQWEAFVYRPEFSDSMGDVYRAPTAAGACASALLDVGPDRRHQVFRAIDRLISRGTHPSGRAIQRQLGRNHEGLNTEQTTWRRERLTALGWTRAEGLSSRWKPPQSRS